MTPLPDTVDGNLAVLAEAIGQPSDALHRLAASPPRIMPEAQVAAIVADFAAEPRRLLLGTPARPNLPQATVDPLYRAVDRHAADTPRCRGPFTPQPWALHLIALGVGDYLPGIVARFPTRHLLICDTDLGRLAGSAWTLPWADWAKGCASRGGRLQVLQDDDIGRLNDRLCWALRETDFGLLDGAWLVPPLGRDDLRPIYDELAEALPNLMASKGFFEDEQLMLTNSVANLGARPVQLLSTAPRAAKTLPAVIVGSGPSLDRALPALSRLADGAAVFSAGSTLRILLDRGITPDFHCEIENQPANYDHLAEIATRHDLRRLTLIAPPSVDPRMPPLFGRTLTYVRDAGITEALFGAPSRTIHNTAPNCVNLALRMAILFGFGEIALFGIDFGSRRPDQHHAAGSIWREAADWHERYTRNVDPMALPEPGNLGGTVYSNRVLLQARMMIETVLTLAPHIRVFNASDGVRIAGTRPKAPGALRYPPDPAGKARLADDEWAAATAHPPGALVDPATLGALDRAMIDWCASGAAAALRAAAAGGGLVALNDCLTAALRAIPDDRVARAVEALVEGSLLIMLRQANYYAFRWNLGEDRAFTAAIAAAVADGIDLMARSWRQTAVTLPLVERI